MEKDIVGMVDAAKILQVADHRVARRILQREGINLSRQENGLLVALASEVNALASRRGGKVGPGRPRLKNIPARA
jgi:hypothetical protein